MGVRGLSFYTPRNAPKTNTLFLLSEKRLLPLPSAVFPFPSLNNKYRYQLSNQILKVISNNGILFLMGASLNMKYAKIQFILLCTIFWALTPSLCVCAAAWPILSKLRSPSSICSSEEEKYEIFNILQRFFTWLSKCKCKGH